ncbi:MAG: hypothetical protein COU29_03010 [Candidatus Magasanikbacteria bacterium CG10_big_fil_rev_8_21_14_0_10_36_32]|uniref:Uncharacterized protein n=1 Tax=Candidatus Magasanikbacteria bacterium CG10_big_fil_rev_8_21_14_0_10_36_32 TaxID=1974646 RepID=A0A2M6W666_9BACT|nr:MAG: hypothetical protein COU29_03010 [Candidatus Magasanikbacteria bacterium CG10_big_fil_rev_8_21_14_0_10_36_32]
MEKRTLFFSFNGAVTALKKNLVSIDDLAKGLFCIVYTRAFFDQYKRLTELLCSDQYFNAVFLAVKLADDTGRCLWQDKRHVPSQYGQLKLLLRNNGYPIGLTPIENKPIDPREVKKIIKSIGLSKGLNVIL